MFLLSLSLSVCYHFRKMSMMKYPGVYGHNGFIAQTIAMYPLTSHLEFLVVWTLGMNCLLSLMCYALSDPRVGSLCYILF